jgi:hypothetical protein
MASWYIIILNMIDSALDWIVGASRVENEKSYFDVFSRGEGFVGKGLL